ncbi:MAG: zf-HC2 domain-containing protein [Acidobacteria bacterium]|nr:zf-HC2 domain-containing protein [Acidobacteriota bacterium]
MRNCESIDLLLTPYVDGEIPSGERPAVEEHLRRCDPCRARVAAERAVRSLIQARRSALAADCAPPGLRDACARAAEAAAWSAVPAPATGWKRRLVPLALAASLVVAVAGAFLYQLTASSATILAAELAADHVKCFAINDVFDTHQSRTAVERSMAAGFGWPARLPPQPEAVGLELVGARPCLYGEGRAAHIMYRYHGRPVSLFMLPDTIRQDAVISVLGHECAIWSEGDRTFVMISREPRNDMRRIASFVHASLR